MTVRGGHSRRARLGVRAGMLISAVIAGSVVVGATAGATTGDVGTRARDGVRGKVFAGGSRTFVDDRVVVGDGTQVTGPGGFNAPNDSVPWGLDRIDQRTSVLNKSYNWDVDGTGVTVYVVDSGVRANHVEFGARVAPGWSYRTSPTLMALTSYPADSCTNDPGYDAASYEYDPDQFDFPNPLPTAEQDKGWIDNDGHGTHVAGIIGGELTGVAKGVTIVPVRILSSCGSGDEQWFLAGLNWILSQHSPGEKSVVNMSVGSNEVMPDVVNKINELVDAGIVVVGAAGNGTFDSSAGANRGIDACTTTPGNSAKVIIVGATDASDNETGFSNFGTCVDVFAPGSSIVSAYPYVSGVAQPYVAMTGTSMASPAVAGAAALRLQSSPTDTPAQVAQWMLSRATGCAVRPFNSARATQTPNLLLNVTGPAAAPCAPRSPVVVSGNRALTVSWTAPVSNNGAAIADYTAVTSPGGHSCTSVGTSCTISNLSAGVTYSVNVTARNSAGVGTGATATAVAGGVPDTPSTLVAKGTNGSVTFSWGSITSEGLAYSVVIPANGKSCVTTTNTCAITGLRNGSPFTYQVKATSASGVSSKVISGSARAGFTVGKTKVVRRSRTALSKIVVSASAGRKTWSVNGGCRLSGSYLLAPARKTGCTLVLKVARKGSYPAMSTIVKVAVS